MRKYPPAEKRSSSAIAGWAKQAAKIAKVARKAIKRRKCGCMNVPRKVIWKE